MSLALIVKEGPLAGQRFELGAERIIGRGGPGVVIDDPEMSRRHAVIRDRGGRLEIEDLGSRNGTWVNGTRIAAPTPLDGGDTVKLGETTFEIEGIVRTTKTVASARPVAASTGAALAPSDAPAEPFGAFAASAPARARIASRQLVPELIAFAVVFATAAALAVYFALR